MSKRWSIGLFATVFLLMFVFFQFDSDSRRKMRYLEQKQIELELQLQTMARSLANQSTASTVSELRQTQDFLIKEFRNHRSKVTQLLELLISKDEGCERELEAYKSENGFRAREELVEPIEDETANAVPSIGIEK